jgi:hypothetical protein
MKANMLDYMYEGYGYDTDNQLLYTDVKNFDETLSESGKMTTRGMETLAYNGGPIAHDPAIPTEEDNKYIETASFISESGAKYTDLRQGLCGCCQSSGDTGTTITSPVTQLGEGESFTNGD